MDKWNRNDQNAYTGITAQRRNRRRADTELKAPAASAVPEGPATDTEPEVSPESLIPERFRAYMKPVEPKKQETVPEPAETEDEPDGFDEPARPESVGDSEEPEEPDEAEEPGESGEDEEPGEFEEDEGPAEPAQPKEPAEPETLFETEETNEPAQSEESDENSEPEEPEEPEKSSEAEDASGPEEHETPAEAKAPEITAETPVVQGADSRVPEEARRMAAAPYGTANPAARRMANRPQAQRRTAAPEGGRTTARPRRDLPGQDTTPGGRIRPQGNLRDARVHVGYAPGRMSDDMTQQIPVRDGMRESPYTRDAKAYLEKRGQPFRTGNNGGGKMQDKPGHKGLRAAVALLVVAGLILTGWMIMKNRNGKDNKTTREAPKVISFTPEDTEGRTAPADLNFQAVTEKDVEGIRLRAEGDGDLDTVATFGDNADSKVWNMKMTVATGFKGTVKLQVRRGEEEGWYDTDWTAEVDVSSPLSVEPQEGDDSGKADGEDGKTTGSGKEDPEGTEGETEDDSGDEAGDAEDGPEKPEKQSEDGEGDELPAGELKTSVPTATPAPVTPEPTVTPPLTVDAGDDAGTSKITTTVYTSFTKKEKAYSRPAKELIHMPEADKYTKEKLGVMTFRGDNFRRNAAVGTMSAEPTGLAVLWQTEGGKARGTNQMFYGYGWTGQPVIARWSTEVRSHTNITEAKIEKKALKEVIIAGLDGTIRFLDLEDGKITRNSIKLGYAMRGTPSLHPDGFAFMAVGQYARRMKGKSGMIGLRQYNLFSQKALKLIDGLDGKYHRPLNNVGSFETSALIDRVSDTLIAVGTNGALYLESLGSTFDYNLGVMTISPSTTVMISKVKGQKNKALYAVESSPAAYDRYVFYADMSGLLRCVDTNTLTPVWAAETGDSVMAAVALDLTKDRELNLYTANMLNNRKKGKDIQIRRYNALTGKQAWSVDIGVARGKKDKSDIGAKASPVIGQNRLEGLVYFTVTGLSSDGRSKLGLYGEEKAALIALDKDTGKVVWAYGLDSRSESSPIALYDDYGNGWILQCEQNGTVHLVEGLSGTRVDSMNLQADIEASPAAYNNVVVIGTTGKDTAYVYGIEVKLNKAKEEPKEEAQEKPQEPAAEESKPEAEPEGEAEWADEGPEEEPDWPDEEPEEIDDLEDLVGQAEPKKVTEQTAGSGNGLADPEEETGGPVDIEGLDEAEAPDGSEGEPEEEPEAMDDLEDIEDLEDPEDIGG